MSSIQEYELNRIRERRGNHSLNPMVFAILALPRSYPRLVALYLSSASSSNPNCLKISYVSDLLFLKELVTYNHIGPSHLLSAERTELRADPCSSRRLHQDDPETARRGAQQEGARTREECEVLQLLAMRS